MNKNKLILMVGLPRSGKTLWATRQQHPIVNRDAIRLVLHGQRYAQAAEDMVTAIETYMVKALFQAGHSTVIVDATHNTAKRRDRWANNQWDVELKKICTSESDCIARAEKEGDAVIIPIIKKMAAEADWI